ncbi:MAG TPA: DUF5009 domain-containing protein [Armatimonadota bacterium]|jgi:predicted acyltransferase
MHRRHKHQDAPLTQAQGAPRRPDNRASALDALRGLAILAMVLSGLVPGTLPAWMYHAQDAPPTHVTNINLAGISWVDVVFPFFIFSMGAAIPLALSRRLEKAKWWSVIPGILWRGVLLAAFAFFRDHVDPFAFTNSPTRHDWKMALVALVLVFPIWGRMPKTIPQAIQWLIRVVGVSLALVLLSTYRYSDNANLAWNHHAMRQWVERGDIIILVLANVSVFGSLIWLCTRKSWFARLAPVGLMVALKISASAPGWGQTVWNATPVPWLYRMEFLKYLTVILPATIVGDLMVDWLRARAKEHVTAQWPLWRLIPLTVLLFAFVPVCVTGLMERWVIATTLVTVGMLLLGALLTMKPLTELERFITRSFQWGAYWLILGLVFEPYEGGIKKSNATISYFFVTLGLAILTLAAFTLLIERLKGRWSVALLVDNGQNPLLAYIGISSFALPVVVLSGLGAWLDARLTTPWQGALHAAIVTLFLALAVSAATRAKVFVRA